MLRGFVRWFGLTALCALALLPLLAGARSPSAEHLYLEAEVPKADTTIPSPSRIVLYFSQEPLPNRTKIRLFDAASNKELAVGPVYGDSLDPFVFASDIPGKLPAGKYKVSWLTYSDDEPDTDPDGLLRDGGWAFTVVEVPRGR